MEHNSFHDFRNSGVEFYELHDFLDSGVELLNFHDFHNSGVEFYEFLFFIDSCVECMHLIFVAKFVSVKIKFSLFSCLWRGILRIT